MGIMDRLRSEYAYVRGALGMLSKVTPIAKARDVTFPQRAAALAREHGDRPALVSERERFTFREWNARADQYARWAREIGLQKGECVALLMPNRPEYYAVWLGIARAGGVTALLNTNLSGAGLAHCINIVEARHIIVDAALGDTFETALPHLKGAPRLWRHGAEAEGWTRLEPHLDRQSKEAIPDAELPKLTTEDRCLYIYTSGTTGSPKAANINHYRVQAIMYGFSAATRFTPDDRLYVCLPLYHSTGLLVGGAAALVAGASVVIRERFSASQFWDDVVDHGATAFVYVGELCRYLLNSPPHPKETRHKLRLAYGNGLRPDIWEAFQSRFKVPRIFEWYAATEGNAALFNLDGRVGAVGRIPFYLKRRFLIEIVRFDIDAEQPVRGPDGFCIRSAPGEVGEMISQIVNDPSKPSQRFEGYADPEATSKKILTDVFEKGDRWFRTGDLMRRDEQGYFYFVDRIGDTFRWKGENVATSEVAEAMSVFPGVREVNVYGVRVPGQEGRAGMAAVAADPGLDLAGLYAHVAERLPPYARPVFLRLQDSIEATGTFKQRKVDLVREGFDPSVVADPLYVADHAAKTYVPLDAERHRAIVAGGVKL